MTQSEMLTLIERILDSKYECDKWAHQAELAYIQLGGTKRSLIAPTLRERMDAKKLERSA